VSLVELDSLGTNSQVERPTGRREAGWSEGDVELTCSWIVISVVLL
jgi:hypothetical protein